MTSFHFNPDSDALARVRTVEDLHQASYAIARTRLVKKLDGEDAPGDAGVCFLVTGKDQDLLVEGVLTPLIQGLGSAWIEIPGRVLKTGREVRTFFAGWVSLENYRKTLPRLPGPRGWLSHTSFMGGEGPKAMFEKAGLVLNQPILLDLYDTLSRSADDRESTPTVQLEPSFDYGQDLGNPDDPFEMCYTRCVWGVDEVKGLVVSRSPGSCWEASHNARLQAGSPRMFQALKAIASGAPDAQTHAKAVLSELLDPDWQDWMKTPAGRAGGITPADVLRHADGRELHDQRPKDLR